MKRIGAALVGVSALVLAMAASGQAQSPAAPSMSEAVQAPSVPAGTETGVRESSPLFRIGEFPVFLWAPVEPPYDTHMNRNLAADPLWEAGTPTTGSGF